MIGSTEERKGTTTGFWQAEESEGTNADVLEAGTLGQYLKTRSEEADDLGCAKGNRN